MTTRSRVVSVKPNSDSTTRNKSKKSTLSSLYNSVFGPSESKLASIARFRGLIEQSDKSLNKFIDRDQPDIYADISTLREIRTRNYENLSKATRLTAKDKAADEAIRARIKEYYSRQPLQRLGGTRKRRKNKKHKKKTYRH